MMKIKHIAVDEDVHKMIKKQATDMGMSLKSYLRKLAYENMK